MGCNTSKESVQQAVEEAKEDAKEMAKDIARDILKDDTKEETKNGDVPKSASSTAAAEETSEQQEANDTKESEEKEEDKDNETAEAAAADDESGDKSKEEEAATRIQAVFRGHHVRKNLKENDEPEESSSILDQAKSELGSIKDKLTLGAKQEVKELVGAASIAQASLRDHMSKKVEQAAGAAKELAENVAQKVEEKVSDTVDELEGIDLSDPDLHKAATKIQASFRGHKVRQEVVPENEKK